MRPSPCKGCRQARFSILSARDLRERAGRCPNTGRYQLHSELILLPHKVCGYHCSTLPECHRNKLVMCHTKTQFCCKLLFPGSSPANEVRQIAFHQNVLLFPLKGRAWGVLCINRFEVLTQRLKKNGVDVILIPMNAFFGW